MSDFPKSVILRVELFAHAVCHLMYKVVTVVEELMQPQQEGRIRTCTSTSTTTTTTTTTNNGKIVRMSEVHF